MALNTTVERAGTARDLSVEGMEVVFKAILAENAALLDEPIDESLEALAEVGNQLDLLVLEADLAVAALKGDLTGLPAGVTAALDAAIAEGHLNEG